MSVLRVTQKSHTWYLAYYVSWICIYNHTCLIICIILWLSKLHITMRYVSICDQCNNNCQNNYATFLNTKTLGNRVETCSTVIMLLFYYVFVIILNPNTEVVQYPVWYPNVISFEWKDRIVIRNCISVQQRTVLCIHALSASFVCHVLYIVVHNSR